MLEEANSTIYSDKAVGDLKLLSSWFPRGRENLAKIAPRPAYRSDFNYTEYYTRAQLRGALGLLLLRELPIKNFYVRCWVGYFYCIFFLLRGNGRGMVWQRPLVMYGNQHNFKPLLNYPDLLKWVTQKVIPKNPIAKDPHKEWMIRQQPVFHQYHKTVYRYRQRKPRYVAWDGTMSQPTMPFMVDVGTEVINGTFRRNCNTVPQLK